MQPWYSLETKTVWVTGGAGHLGSAITVALDGQAHQVVCFDLEARAGHLVRERGLTRTIPVTLDVTELEQLPARIDSAIAEHGLPDAVVHLPTASSRGETLESLSPAMFQQTFDRGLTPTFTLCRALAERMKPRGRGTFVLFASMYGVVAPDPRIYRAPMTPNPIDYGAAKAALIQLTRYLAVHYGPAGLRFNCVTRGRFQIPTSRQQTRSSSATSQRRPRSAGSAATMRSSAPPSSC